MVALFKGKTPAAYCRKREDDIINLLKRRPCAISDISSSLGIHKNELTKYLKEMERGGKVESFIHASQTYFRALTTDKLKIKMQKSK